MSGRITPMEEMPTPQESSRKHVIGQLLRAGLTTQVSSFESVLSGSLGAQVPVLTSQVPVGFGAFCAVFLQEGKEKQKISTFPGKALRAVL